MRSSPKVRIIVIAAAMLALAVLGFAVYWETHHGNRQLVDLQYRFNYGIIRLPNGEVVEGKVSSWYDYPDSDTVQVTIDGTTCLTHYANACLMEK